MKEKMKEDSKMTIYKKLHAPKHPKKVIDRFPEKVDGVPSCRFCLRILNDHYSKRNHQKSCPKNPDCIKSHECPQCDHKCSTEVGLKTHIESKHGKNSKPFKCTVCGMEYKTLRSLKRHCHEQIHSFSCNEDKLDNEDRRCVICYKKVKDMECHMKKHTKTFKCDRCDFYCIRKDNLARHLKLKHQVDNKDLKWIEREFLGQGGKVYKCQKCKQEFNKISDIKKHVSLVGCTENKCSVCGKDFSMKQHLKRHLQKVHKVSAP